MPLARHVLTVVDHPDPGSFTHALADRFEAGARAAGCGTERADLHAEGFDPRWSLADVTGNAPDIPAQQARITRCDALCLVFPLFWFGMPAMTKGWMDRVWTHGWAYDQIADPHQSLQPERIGVLLVPAGGNPQTWAAHGLEHAMRTQWQTGMMGYFGLSDQRVHILAGAHGSERRRTSLLERAYQAGRTL